MATYKGTKITGTSTSSKVFRSSGISDARLNQTYLNTSTGHVYECTTAGKPSVAKWRYVRTDVIGKPSSKVSKHANLARGNGLAYASTWKVHDALKDSKSGRRATKLSIVRKISGKNGKKAFSVSASTASAAINTENASINIASFAGHNRNYYHPYTKRTVSSMSVAVKAANAKGVGPASTVSHAVSKPKVPSLAWSLDTETGRITLTATPANDSGFAERARTMVQYYRKDIGSAAAAADKKWRPCAADASGATSSTSTSDVPYAVGTWDVSSWQNPAHHWVYRARAKSQGLAGDSAWTSWIYRVVGFPKAPTRGSVTIRDKSNGQSTGTLAVKSTNLSKTTEKDGSSYYQYPVTGIRLQKLVSTDAATDYEAKASSGWDDTDSVDNGSCTALSFTVADVMPDEGTHTWLRIKAWHDSEGVFTAYSEPVELKSLFKAAPSAADNECSIVSVSPNADGSSVTVVVGWDKASSPADDDTTSMLLSWSSDEDAWTSTEPPDPFEFDWNDDSSASSDWRKTATVKVKGLEEGETYWFRARCRVSGETVEDGPWCTKVSGIPSTIPASAALTAPASVATGQGIPFSWSFAGGGVQKSWQLVLPGDTAILAEGKGGMQSCSVPAERAADFAENGVLSVFARISTGGGSIDSAPIEVTIADAPALEFGDIGDLMAQPLSIPLVCSEPDCPVAVIVSAAGAEDAAPGGPQRQAEGDTVWSDVLNSLEWAYDPQVGAYTATATAPLRLDFWDGCRYAVDAMATSAATGLQSNAAACSFAVAWEYQALAPPDGIEIMPETITDADTGQVSRIATIALEAPDGAEETDVYDVYRVTGDGAELIAYGAALDAVLVDRYSPFGNATCIYRVATRTVDGDVAWRDYDYQADGPGLRIDFDGESHDYVELKWNLRKTDSYKKDFRESKAMDGTVAGAWNAGVSRRASYGTDVVRVTEQGVIDALRDLGRHAGACFVRTNEGLAFAANVEVDSMEFDDRGSACVAASLSATMVSQDGRFDAEVSEAGENE